MSLPLRPDHRLAADLDLIRFVATLSPAKRRLFVARLAAEDGDSLEADWRSWAHDGQLAPPGDWATWVLMAGRGFGKTLAGAQWLTGLIGAGEGLSIALVGATLEDAQRVMVEGRSGLMTVAAGLVDRWEPSRRRLSFVTGAAATIFSGASPDLLRGPEHHYAWCDELAKWARPEDCWNMLQLGLRLGARPRALITTTPRAGAALDEIMAAPGTVLTGGSTHANPHVSKAWKAQMHALYGGTRLGRQELDGELLPEAGALWTPELIERCRLADPPPASWGRGTARACAGGGGAFVASETPNPEAPPPPPPAVVPLPTAWGGSNYVRTLIAVDPPSGDGTCGIIACARDGDDIGHVLADHSVTGRSPEGWARAVADAAAAHRTREVVAEANQGGKMVRAVLLTAEPSLRVRLVHASTGKTARAEPVAHLFEAGRVVLHGRFPALEAQLLGLIAGGGYQGPGASPDRADAMVWGLTEVMREVGARVRAV